MESRSWLFGTLLLLATASSTMCRFQSTYSHIPTAASTFALHAASVGIDEDRKASLNFFKPLDSFKSARRVFKIPRQLLRTRPQLLRKPSVSPKGGGRWRRKIVLLLLLLK
jgi:hypothetical protein